MVIIVKPVKCEICGDNSTEIAAILRVCVNCIRDNPDQSSRFVEEAHKKTRLAYTLPESPPQTRGGISCKLCANECVLGVGERGYCGLRENQNGVLTSSVNADNALLHAYLDPHITNCCASWFCPAATGSGYPRYSHTPKWEHGYYNYSVFFYGCNFNCLFCQNYFHKHSHEGKLTSVDTFIGDVQSQDKISCICYFGGSPEPQLPFALQASKKLLEYSSHPILRICFEWNGCGNRALVKEAAELSFNSGGLIKFDLKCFTPVLSIALSVVNNDAAYRNFEFIARNYYEERSTVPLLTATTLLIPGYIDAYEIEKIAAFIADLNPEIPYSLLLFHPDFYMSDMPYTSKKQLNDCLKTAKNHLTNVHAGNLQLLGLSSMM